MRQPELTSLIGLRDSAGDRLILLRLDRPDGTRGYMLRVGTGSVFLTAGDLEGLSTVIRFELVLGESVPILRPGDLASDRVRTGVAPHIRSHRAVVCVPLVELTSAAAGNDPCHPRSDHKAPVASAECIVSKHNSGDRLSAIRVGLSKSVR